MSRKRLVAAVVLTATVLACSLIDAGAWLVVPFVYAIAFTLFRVVQHRLDRKLLRYWVAGTSLCFAMIAISWFTPVLVMLWRLAWCFLLFMLLFDD